MFTIAQIFLLFSATYAEFEPLELVRWRYQRDTNMQGLGIAMKKILLAALAATTVLAAQAHAADIAQEPSGFRPYIGVFGDFTFVPSISASDGGFSIPVPPFFIFPGGPGKLNWKPGDAAGVVLGGHLGQDWRVDVELSRAFNAINNFTYDNGNVNYYAGGGVDQTYALANVWYDFHTDSAWTPYIGGGLGIGWAGGSINIPFAPISYGVSPTSGLAFQVGVGAQYAVSDSVSFDFSYRLKGITGLHPVVTTGLEPFLQDTVDQSTVISHNLQVGATFHF